MLGANVESFKNLEENLKAHGMKLAEIPHVIQFNKRDLPKLSGDRRPERRAEQVQRAVLRVGRHDGHRCPGHAQGDRQARPVEPDAEIRAQVGRRRRGRRAARRGGCRHGSMASAPAAPRRAAAPVAESSADRPTPRRKRRARPFRCRRSKPRRRRVEPSPSRGPTPASRPAPVEAITSFGEDEIDGLVGEVEEIDAPIGQLPPAEEGAWMGTPETRTSRRSPTRRPRTDRTFRSTSSSKPNAPPAADPAPQPAWRPALEQRQTSKSTAASTRVERLRRRRSRRLRRRNRPRCVHRADGSRSDRTVSRSGPERPTAEADLTLTEVASDDDLFCRSEPRDRAARRRAGARDHRARDARRRRLRTPLQVGDSAASRCGRLRAGSGAPRTIALSWLRDTPIVVLRLAIAGGRHGRARQAMLRAVTEPPPRADPPRTVRVDGDGADRDRRGRRRGRRPARAGGRAYADQGRPRGQRGRL